MPTVPKKVPPRPGYTSNAAEVPEVEVAPSTLDYPAVMDEVSKQPSRLTRRLISVALLAWLAILILGPLSNPVGSEHLTKPLAEKVSPLHRMMFLGHGYRFFAPDPGPSHLVEYEIKLADGSTINGMFPDKDGPMTFPRLNYHRWFMLSETIWSCLLYTSPSPRDATLSRMPSSA